MSQISFKQMIKDGVITRGNALRVALDDIHEEPGFNLRAEGPDLEQSIQALADHIMQGGMYPPLEVRPRDAGGVWVVDGHRRRRALLVARESGAPIDLINIVPFVGNDAYRVARIMTSAEGRALSPLETAEGYKRLSAFGLSATEIAKRVGKTRQHVDGLLMLANANVDVHRLVHEGDVSATTAMEAVRKRGEGAGEFLSGKVDQAKAAGKSKATAKTIKGKKVPQKLVDGLLAAVERYVASLQPEGLATLEAIIESSPQPDPVALVGAVELRDLIAANDAIIAAKAA